MERDSFIFYRSFYEAVLELPENAQKDVLLAIANYSLNFQEPELKGLSRAVWILIKPQLDANNQRYKNGKKGGRKTKPKPKVNQTETKPEANKNVNVNDNENNNVNILLEKETKGRFIPPTLEEVKDFFILEKVIAPDEAHIPDQFFNYYESNGWKVGKNKMKNWRAAAGGWLSRERKPGNDKPDKMETIINW